MPISAVITGDIVNSTRLSKTEFNKLINTIRQLLTPYKSEFFRGDSFQVYMKETDNALLLLLRIRIAAKKAQLTSGVEADIRSAIGIGKIASPVRKLSTSTEEPFVLSGRSLDDLPAAERLVIQSNDRKANCAFTVIARFIDHVYMHITAKQAAVIYELLMGHNQTATARKLKKSQVTIHRQAHAAGWLEISRLLADYKTTINEFQLK